METLANAVYFSILLFLLCYDGIFDKQYDPLYGLPLPSFQISPPALDISSGLQPDCCVSTSVIIIKCWFFILFLSAELNFLQLVLSESKSTRGSGC